MSGAAGRTPEKMEKTEKDGRYTDARDGEDAMRGSAVNASVQKWLGKEERGKREIGKKRKDVGE